jgi:hypothetical protein
MVQSFFGGKAQFDCLAHPRYSAVVDQLNRIEEIAKEKNLQIPPIAILITKQMVSPTIIGVCQNGKYTVQPAWVTAPAKFTQTMLEMSADLSSAQAALNRALPSGEKSLIPSGKQNMTSTVTNTQPASIGVAAGLVPTPTNEETPKERADRLKAAGQWKAELPVGEVYTGPTGADDAFPKPQTPPPVDKKTGLPWWQLALAAAGGAGAAYGATRLADRNRSSSRRPRVVTQVQPQFVPQQSSSISPAVIVGGLLVVGVLGFVAYRASK